MHEKQRTRNQIFYITHVLHIHLTLTEEITAETLTMYALG